MREETTDSKQGYSTYSPEVVEKMIDLIMKYFWNPHARVGANISERGGSIEVKDTRAAVRAHILGEAAPKVDAHIPRTPKREGWDTSGWFRIGFYSPGNDGLTKWLCFDFDGGNLHKSSLADAEGVAKRVLGRLVEMGVPAYLEKSGGGQGWEISRKVGDRLSRAYATGASEFRSVAGSVIMTPSA